MNNDDKIPLYFNLPLCSQVNFENCLLEMI